MLKKLILSASLTLSAMSFTAHAFWQSDITMLVVPREAIPLQIAQDISRRYPVLLVSYQIAQSELKLHAWNGDGWVGVPVEDYANGTFFANRPKHAIVVEYEKFRAPAALTPNSTWCESANRLSTTNPRAMLHLLGLYFDFPFRYWDQLAQRYGYSLEEINPTLSNVHWWNIRGDELVEKRAKRDFSIDLDKWHYLGTLPPPPIKPVMLDEEPKSIPEVEVPAAEPVKVITVNTPVAPEEKAPAIKPVPVAVKTAPPVKSAPATTIPTSIPALTPAPEKTPLPSLKPEPVIIPTPAVEPLPEVKPAPAIEPTQAVMPAPAPLIELPSASPTAIEADPFSTEEIPAAEIVVPQAPKKPWWKLF